MSRSISCKLHLRDDQPLGIVPNTFRVSVSLLESDYEEIVSVGCSAFVEFVEFLGGYLRPHHFFLDRLVFHLSKLEAHSIIDLLPDGAACPPEHLACQID